MIFNADDYGLCAKVNIAVEELIDAGRLRDVSILANGEMWESSVRFLESHRQVSAGVHLNAIEGQPVSTAPE
ncbi:MAG: ChbG/HpnK family deacetylase, partial [Blastocatellia bacterium]